MTIAHPAYLEFIDFIAAGITPEQIIAFRPSLRAQQRVEELIAREKEDIFPPMSGQNWTISFNSNIYSA